MHTQNLIDIARQYTASNYFPAEIVIKKGRRARLYDTDDREYIDFAAGISVCNLGHCNPNLIETLTAQAHELWHCSNYFYNENAIFLIKELVDRIEMCDSVFLCNSGSEANETAFKLARAYASFKLPEKQREILSLQQSFHGRTMAATAATGQSLYHSNFEPLPPFFRHCQVNDETALDEAISERTCAVIFEPIQGEGGVRPIDHGFALKIQERCHQVGAILIVDEIQAGLGRCGALLASDHIKDLNPDVITLAKGLGNGIPIGATLLGKKLRETFKPGSHGSTFGGNPIACAVAREVLKTIDEPAFLQSVNEKGILFRQQITQIMGPLIEQVRGSGLMLGACLSSRAQGQSQKIVESFSKHGVLALRAGADVVRFLPPLTIEKQDMEEGFARMKKAISKIDFA